MSRRCNGELLTQVGLLAHGRDELTPFPRLVADMSGRPGMNFPGPDCCKHACAVGNDHDANLEALLATVKQKTKVAS